MGQETRIAPADFFWNAAAQEAGFSGQFWYVGLGPDCAAVCADWLTCSPNPDPT